MDNHAAETVVEEVVETVESTETVEHPPSTEAMALEIIEREAKKKKSLEESK